MRKENGFEVTDHIKVSLSGNEKLQAIVEKNEDYLKEITLADEVNYGKLSGNEKEWNINGENIIIAVE
jgi:isoleucyl-tRNA synthetase